MRDGLAEHAGLGFDAADAPAENAEAVDHGGVGVGADQGIGVGLARRLAEHDGGQIFQVDLMDDAGVGRHDAEIAEGGLAPAQEDVALAVALEFEQGVEAEGVRGAEAIHLNGVVDDQIGGQERVGAVGVGAHGGQGVAHGGEVHHARDAGEILQENARGHEADFLGAGRALGHVGNVGGGHAASIFLP